MPTYIADTIPLWREHLVGLGHAEAYIKLRMTNVAGPRVGFITTVQKLKGPRPTTGQIDLACVDRYLADHQGGGGSRANKLGALKGYFTWLENRGLLRPGMTAAKLLEGRKAKREQRAPKYYIPAEDFGPLLSVAHDPRDRGVLAMALYTLTRQSEIASVTLRQVAEAGQTMEVWRMKRKRWTPVPIGRELRAELDSWLKAYAADQGYASWQKMAADHPDWYLFPAKNTGSQGWSLKTEVPLTQMERVVKLALTDLGVTLTRDGKSVKHLGEGIHTIRRSGARVLFDRLATRSGYEAALTFVQAMLDHESSQMTLRYIGLDWVREQVHKWIQEHGMYE